MIVCVSYFSRSQGNVLLVSDRRIGLDVAGELPFHMASQRCAVFKSIHQTEAMIERKHIKHPQACRSKCAAVKLVQSQWRLSIIGRRKAVKLEEY
jgi:hypothetical protein